MGRVVGDRYRLTSVIGMGGMGVVYEAQHLAIGRTVAIKVLLPENSLDRGAASRMRQEARIAGALGHPNICAIYDMGRLEDGSPYLVMERLHGETLADRLKRERRIGLVELGEIVGHVLSGLSFAHQRGVIHRDLKPDNVFLVRGSDRRTTPKLLDFGISKSDGMEESIDSGDMHRAATGTPYYMAPEQARGDRVDYRADLWAVGVLLYAGLTGRQPFDAANYNALLVQILTTQHRSVSVVDPRIPADFARVVDRALAKRPEDRFQSALEMQQALGAFARPARQMDSTADDEDQTTLFRREALPPGFGARPRAARAEAKAATRAASPSSRKPEVFERVDRTRVLDMRDPKTLARPYADDEEADDDKTIVEKGPPAFDDDKTRVWSDMLRRKKP